MRMYDMLKKDCDNPAVKKGYYGRYGHSKTHRNSYKVSERVIKRQARNEAKIEINIIMKDLLETK